MTFEPACYRCDRCSAVELARGITLPACWVIVGGDDTREDVCPDCSTEDEQIAWFRAQIDAREAVEIEPES